LKKAIKKSEIFGLSILSNNLKFKLLNVVILLF